MDWTKLIGDLMSEKVTQAEIAEHCGVSQGSVSDLYRGVSKGPSFDFGTRLVALHGERCGKGGRKVTEKTLATG